MSPTYETLTRSFESGAVDGANFSHRDHVVVAYHMLRDDEFLSASYRYAQGIRTLAQAAGAPDKFNTTITLAFLSVIAERMQTTAHSDFDSFASANADLLESGFVKNLYSSSRLQSALARQVFLLPNKAA